MTDIYGWVGMVLIVAAYAANVTGRIKATEEVYLVANLLGALGIGVNVYSQQAWPAFALQVVWGLVAFVGYVGAADDA